MLIIEIQKKGIDYIMKNLENIIKKNNAITLIALVITIVLLIIFIHGDLEMLLMKYFAIEVPIPLFLR